MVSYLHQIINQGYTYRRLPSATPLPSTTWNSSQWSTTDPENYSNIGQYSLFVSNYQYSVDSGTYQSGTTFTGLTPRNHSLVVHDLINDCYSSPLTFTIDEFRIRIQQLDSLIQHRYVLLMLQTLYLLLASGFTTGGLFSASPSGLDIDPNTGVINLANSTVGSYTVTYTYSGSSVNCINTGTDTAKLILRRL